MRDQLSDTLLWHLIHAEQLPTPRQHLAEQRCVSIDAIDNIFVSPSITLATAARAAATVTTASVAVATASVAVAAVAIPTTFVTFTASCGKPVRQRLH